MTLDTEEKRKEKASEIARAIVQKNYPGLKTQQSAVFVGVAYFAALDTIEALLGPVLEQRPQSELFEAER